MDPHLPSNPNSHEPNSGGSPWHCVEVDEEEVDWNIDESNGEEYAREPKNEDKVFDDEEEEYVKDENEEEEDEGLDDYAERRKELGENGFTGMLPSLNGLSNLQVAFLNDNEYDSFLDDFFRNLTSLSGIY